MHIADERSKLWTTRNSKWTTGGGGPQLRITDLDRSDQNL